MWTLVLVFTLWTEKAPVVIVKDFKTKAGCEFMQKTLVQNTVNVKAYNTSICIKAE